MSEAAFLAAFAKAQGLGSVEELTGQHAKRYSFQINSRERARKAATLLHDKLGIELEGRRVLDVGCAYGSFAIEFAKLGAQVVGIDVNEKWLKLADENARDEVAIPFLRCDASTIVARDMLREHGPFDLVIVNDVFEHIYDTAGVLANLTALMRPGACLYYKIPNGLATRSVLSEGHKKVFGISLLAPDYWPMFVSAPFQIYYRRWEYFDALYERYGFDINDFVPIHDDSEETTKRHITNDVARIRRRLKLKNFESRKQLSVARDACSYYFSEIASDLADERMEWRPLFKKYRQTFWEGALTYRGP